MSKHRQSVLARVGHLLCDFAQLVLDTSRLALHVATHLSRRLGLLPPEVATAPIKKPASPQKPSSRREPAEKAPVDLDLVRALRSMGYTSDEAKRAAAQVNTNGSLAERIRGAINLLSPQGARCTLKENHHARNVRSY